MKISILFFSTILFLNLYGQTSTMFNLDMQTLIEKDLFFPDRGERIFVRGNFNNWEGFEFELVKFGDTYIYSGKFNIDLNVGDTLEYKYIINRKDNRVYWERNPNPQNRNYGNRQLVISGSYIILPLTTFDYDEYIKYPILFKKEKLREDFLQMRKTLDNIHPALYDYTNKKRLDSLFDYYFEQIDSDLKFEEFYNIVSSVLEPIGCGHTKLWIPSDYWDTVPQRFFPLKLYFTNKKVLVKGSYHKEDEIPVGSEIISINGQPIQYIIKELKSICSSDAFINAFKSKTVEKNFSKNYALRFGYPEIFMVKYIPPDGNEEKDIKILPVIFDIIDKYTARGNELSLKLMGDNDVAIITINTFIYYSQLEMFKSFIDSSFEVIIDNNILNLIIDLRGNDGGDPYCSSYLLSYIEKEPIPYFAECYNHYETLAKKIPLAENNFDGNLYTLIDGSCFSTSGHFCALLKYHGIGKFIGTETGATFTCTGNVDYSDLKNTQLILGSAQKQR